VSVGHDEPPIGVIWHDLECGGYGADMGLWRALAAEYGDPVLDVGAGTGRIALELARRGHRVTALDNDPVLLGELARRAGGEAINTVVADARNFELRQRFSLIIVPMQTIQVLGGSHDRRRFLACAAHHLRPGGVTAIAITERLEQFSAGDGLPLPTPDMREIDGVVYSSQATAVREEREAYVLERLRERIGIDGRRTAQHDVARLSRLTAAQLEDEAREVGLSPAGRELVPATADHVGSVVVRLRG
jgi:SAM-dependent methyltransferase